MDIHIVQPADSIYRLSQQYKVPMAQIIEDNQLPDPSNLVVGQAIVIQYPKQVYTVVQGDTLSSVAHKNNLTVRQLMRNNYGLFGQDEIVPGQQLVLSFQQQKKGSLYVNGYAYPFINRDLLQATLPYLSDLTPFTYGITPTGDLVSLDDAYLIHAAEMMGVRPLMHLSTLTEEGGFSNELAHLVLTNQKIQDRLANALLTTIRKKRYGGLDIDFEYVFSDDAEAYAKFVSRMRELLSPLGLSVIVALAPKTFAQQKGYLYEGHNYQLLGQAADQVLLMTYEWGYTYGPPMAVAPIRNVRQVVEYALTEITAEKIWLGVPNYGYDWTLPFEQGSKATSISNQTALKLAASHRTAIRFDEVSQAPWFRYVDGQGKTHEVWFEDARSIQSKLALIPEYNLRGVGYWNLMRPFAQNWVVLNALYNILESPSP